MSKNQKNKFPIIILAVVAFLAAAAGGYFYLSLSHQKSSNSSITKVEETSEESGTVDASLQYSGYVTLLSEEDLITLNFTNPARSKKTLSLEIVANIDGEDIILAKSDKIKPGYKIDSIKYEPSRQIEKGNYKGYFLIHFYGDNDKEEIVNSRVAINIYVK